MPKRTVEQFMERLRGIPAHDIAAVMTQHVSGVYYGGCNKRSLAESWAMCRAFGTLAEECLRKLTLDTIYEEAKQRSEKRKNRNV